MATKRDRERALRRFARAHAGIEENTRARLDAALELREMGVTFPDIAAACTERPITPEGVKMLITRGTRNRD